jgi:ATP-dependent protease HslVU (ClpYQ) peptidase subunit
MGKETGAIDLKREQVEDLLHSIVYNVDKVEYDSQMYITIENVMLIIEKTRIVTINQCADIVPRELSHLKQSILSLV